MIVGFCFAVSCFLCYQHVSPFHDITLQRLQYISLFQVSAIFFIALIIKANFVDGEDVLISIIIVVLIFLSFIFDILRILWLRYIAPEQSNDEDTLNPYLLSFSTNPMQKVDNSKNDSEGERVTITDDLRHKDSDDLASRRSSMRDSEYHDKERSISVIEMTHN